MQLDEVNRLDTICWQLASSLWRFWLCTLLNLLSSKFLVCHWVDWKISGQGVTKWAVADIGGGGGGRLLTCATNTSMSVL